MAGMTYPQVLHVARQLTPDAQWALTEALLHHLRTMRSSQPTSPEQHTLEPILGLTYQELQVLADAVAAADCQERLSQLLAAAHDRALTPEENDMLNSLLAEADQVALLKARALYTIKLFDLPSTSIS